MRDIASFVEPGKHILLKPNLLTAASLRDIYNDPEVVHYMVELVKDVGGKP
ncbi:hypothetical protein [cyanobacterium endosymbiont of Rhopalodia gibberula]|uniref:hypothetical protein n=1 Tax=cyanobacterium endosymbiont of Rhopalodia gibberula TaxID=1763363 RepID=UPI001E524194|nr:hypothetical protein [cyanobacterium endosymbiont of Rhopalodia gibberula]